MNTTKDFTFTKINVDDDHVRLASLVRKKRNKIVYILFFLQYNMVLHCNFQHELNFILIITEVLHARSTMILLKNAQFFFTLQYIYILKKR